MGIDGYNALNKYPTLQDGLALLYAAGEIGDKKATKLAREAAYTEQPSKSSDSKNEGKSTGGGVSKVDYGTNNTPTPTPVNYSYDQNENKGRSIYENNPRANSRDKNNPNIIFSEYIPVKERIYNSLVPDNKNCLTLDDKKKIYAIKNSEDVSTEHAKIMYFPSNGKMFQK